MAITFDAQTAAADSTPGTSTTFSHTCTNASIILVAAGNLAVTSVTYAAVSLTLIQEVVSNTTSQWYLVNPTAGANNVVINHASDNMAGGAISLRGTITDSTVIGQKDVQSKTGTTTAEITLNTLTTNSWLVGQFTKDDDDAPSQTGGGDQTGRYADTPFTDLDGFSATKTVVSSSETMSWSWATSTNVKAALVEIKEGAAAGATFTPRIMVY